jgi:TonB family protein
METNVFDWKDVANSQFDKAVTLALVILLFGIMVTPKVDIKAQKFSQQNMVAVELPAEQREQIKAPDIQVKLQDIVIDDNLTGAAAADPDMMAAVLKQLGGDIFAVTSSTTKSGTEIDERPFDFVEYEDAPEPIIQVAPVYSAMARKAQIERTVVLEVDVYRDGSIGKITVKKPTPDGLDEAAIDAVKKWKFQPGKSGGKAVDTTVIIPIEFTLSKM